MHTKRGYDYIYNSTISVRTQTLALSMAAVLIGLCDHNTTCIWYISEECMFGMTYADMCIGTEKLGMGGRELAIARAPTLFNAHPP